ncbi:MAG: thioredoxin [Curvibacter sp.]|nr:MAG: thioredoxin [Curvibacter sp.]
MNWMGIAVGSVIALFAGMQLLMWIKAKRSVGSPAPDTSSIDGPAASDTRRLYYFYSASCGPCRAIKPLVEKLRQTHRNLIPVDVAQNLDLARQFGIAGTPSFILVSEGAVREVLLGGQSERKLLDLLAGG